MKRRVAHVGAHLPPRGVRLGIAQQTVKEHCRTDPPREHQGLVSVVQVQPIGRPKDLCQHCNGFVARTRHMEESLAVADKLQLGLIDPSGQEHRTIGAQVGV